MPLLVSDYLERALMIVRYPTRTILQGQTAAMTVALSDNIQAKSQFYLRDGEVSACGIMGLWRR